MKWRLLGPVEAVVRGEQVPLGRPQQRAVLACLLLNANVVVSTEQLAEALWGGALPSSARTQVQVCVSRLRQLTRAADVPDMIFSDSGGYRLELADDALDAAVFSALTADARRHADAGEHKRAAALLRQALALWRGPALAGASAAFVPAAAASLYDKRLAAYEDLFDAEFALGQHAAAVAPLRGLVAENPWRESLAARLMTALAASGHQAEALQVFERIRHQLADELGVEPGAQLANAHVQVLRQQYPPNEPPLAVHDNGPGVSPAQLPADLPTFTGREDALAAMDAMLSRAGESTTMEVVAIIGTAGVGKTTLAVRWAHRIAERYPDGQLYVNLRGFDPSGPMMTPAEAVLGCLEALGVPPDRIPTHLPAQVGLYRSLLARRRTLVVLDNARDGDQVRPLLPGSPHCLVVVTSRNRLDGLVASEGARPITVDLLTSDEATQLLVRRLGADRVTAEPQAVDEIIERCAGLPLALAVVAARGTANPAFPLAALAAELRETHRLLGGFNGGDSGVDVQTVFSCSYRNLTPAAARLFRLLSCHPGPEIGALAAASLAGLPRDRVHLLLSELTHAHLVTEHAPGRFGTHDLLRGYAADLAASIDAPDERQAAGGRVLDHYVHTAHAAALLLQPGWDPITLTEARPGVTTAEVTDHDHALAWFTAEYRVLLAAVVHAERTRFEGHAWRLAWTLVDFLQRRGHWPDLAAAQRTALAAAQRSGDRPGQASAHRDLARALARLGQPEEAEDHYHAALKLFAELGDRTGQARTHRAFGAMLDRLGRHTEALHHAEQGLDLYRAAAHLPGQASAENGVGWAHAQLGQYGPALDHCRRALVLLRHTADRHGEANTWDSLGFIHDRLGHHRRAVHCYHRALVLYIQIGDSYDEADTLTRLGDSRLSLDDRAGAIRTWRRALRILEELSHPAAEGVRDRLNRSALRPPGSGGNAQTLDLSVAKTQNQLDDANQS
ncbi:DNA-binding SARP family transcriptional activator/Flp pilus assembly protein TadD [Allocatelliglobosispora scoriae]|uniref:DNA-binding SARP family transcriptional activator/Flp pilus assembly protein TadD n=1 Tax=Allocatelliglobosispora scoriae TaxID=643052 RepID=A0A841BIP8_9ACTN|nr:BTAD domain-containing putative transcriptional regulator [Allocatelliglobosispora scoriae]MBB5867485.1 DNA-binding SARP family transcriptional activator/Flp pilus assembly protein TadD [Allocatelliglobosispora scoriae]